MDSKDKNPKEKDSKEQDSKEKTPKEYGVSKNKSGGWVATIGVSPHWSDAVRRERCMNKETLALGTFATEGEAASAVAQAMYMLLFDQPGDALDQMGFSDLLTSELKDDLEKTTIQKKIAGWAKATETRRVAKKKETLPLRIQRHGNCYRARLPHPKTGNRINLKQVPTKAEAIKSHDKQFLKWYGSTAVDLLHNDYTVYMNDDDVAVAKAAKQIQEGKRLPGEAGVYVPRGEKSAATKALKRAAKLNPVAADAEVQEDDDEDDDDDEDVKWEEMELHGVDPVDHRPSVSRGAKSSSAKSLKRAAQLDALFADSDDEGAELELYGANPNVVVPAEATAIAGGSSTGQKRQMVQQQQQQQQQENLQQVNHHRYSGSLSAALEHVRKKTKQPSVADVFKKKT